MWTRRGGAFQAEDTARAKALGEREARPAWGLLKRTDYHGWSSVNEAEHCKRRDLFGPRTSRSDESDVLCWAGLQLIE